MLKKLASLKDLFNNPINEFILNLNLKIKLKKYLKILKDDGKTNCKY